MSPRRRVLLITLAVILAAGLAAVAVQVILRVAGDRPTIVDQAVPGTVVLVPGYGGSQDALNVLADRLRADGRTVTVVTLPDSGNGDFSAQADALDQLVKQAIDGGAPSVDLVGYSAGGVVVRAWLNRDGTAARTRRVVTLGSPLHGASIAAVGSAVVPGACPTACQQLAPGSAFLTQLNALPIPPTTPWLSVWTLTDQTVRPPDSARLDGAVNLAVQDLCPGATVQHGQLPTDPAVTGLVRLALESPTPLTAAPTDCAQVRTQGS
jgi:triacylglycerol lipase